MNKIDKIIEGIDSIDGLLSLMKVMLDMLGDKLDKEQKSEIVLDAINEAFEEEDLTDEEKDQIIKFVKDKLSL